MNTNTAPKSMLNSVSVNSVSASDEEEKRHRTSPRTKAFDEVLALLDEYIASVRTLANKSKTDEDQNKFCERLEAANELKEKIQVLVVEGVKPEYNGNYYLGVSRVGEKVLFKHHCPPTERSHGKLFKTVCGPFRKKAVVEYMIETNAPLTNVVFAGE